MFQYHLRFGILTINEARERLGLAPVSWGNQPVNRSELFPSTVDSDNDGDPPRASPSAEEDPPEGDPNENEAEKESSREK